MPSLGLGWFIPGRSQWVWGQRERAFQLAGTYLSTLAVGLLTWGTTLGLVMFTVAFSVHVVSIGDALRQASFPGFGRFVPVISSTTGLGFVIYIPTLLAASVFAWPGISKETGRGYLVDRIFYEHDLPNRGDHVWIGASQPNRRPPVAQVLGLEGDEVKWVRGQLQIGHRTPSEFMLGANSGISELAFKVPAGHLLVGFSPGDQPREQWGLINESEVKGRAWVQLYPIWERRLLP